MKRMTLTDDGLQVLMPNADVQSAPRSGNSNPVSASHVRPRFAAPVLARQKGAILPIAIFFFLVLCAGLLVVYNTAQVSSEKRHLTNAADAIAYSTANVAAEGLNYTAYTNRAMVGNYSAVGHMMGMWSNMAMSDQYWRNMPVVLSGVGAIARLIPGVGTAFATAVKAIMKAFDKFAGGWQKITNIMRWAARLLANAGTMAISVTNYALFTSQQVHLASTMSALIEIQQPLLKANAPDAEYDPTNIAYQAVKSVVDFAGMLKLHQPPKDFISSMNTKAKAPIEGAEPFNLINRLMMVDMFIFNNPLNARKLLPNAVGLWMADGGCEANAFNGMLTGLSTDGMSSIFPFLKDVAGINTMEAAIEAFANSVGLLALPLTCLIDRTGGTRMIQLQEGKYAWTSVDVMPLKILGYDIPLAGGVTMSKLGRDMLPWPDWNYDLRQFVEYAMTQPAIKTKYWGESTTPDDCLYITLPTGQVYEPRVGGACLSMAPGSAKQYFQRGALNVAYDATMAAMQGTPVPDARLQDYLTAFADQLNPGNNLNNPGTPPFGGNGNGNGNGSCSTLGAGVGCRNIPGGAPAGSPATGPSLNRPTPRTTAEANSVRNSMSSYSSSFSGNNLQALGTQLRNSFINIFSNNSQIINPPNGEQPADNALKTALELLQLGELYDMLMLESSVGTETLFQKKGKGGLVAMDWGIPFERFGLWEMKDSESGNFKTGNWDASNMLFATPEIQEASLADLGPTFTVGLRQQLGSVPTANHKGLSMGSSRLHMPDWKNGDDDRFIRSIGKARVYYRDPVERWVTRMQVFSHANLMMPYWNAKLEGLSYVEKILFSGVEAMQ